MSSSSNYYKDNKNMVAINFTKSAPAISDFDAEHTVKAYLQDIEKGVEAIQLCNILIWNMLRAELINSPLKFKITWCFEGKPIDMDANMRSNQFWEYPVTELSDRALEKLLAPSRLEMSDRHQAK